MTHFQNATKTTLNLLNQSAFPRGIGEESKHVFNGERETHLSLSSSQIVGNVQVRTGLGMTGRHKGSASSHIGYQKVADIERSVEYTQLLFAEQMRHV